ncbi:hypothetical protein E2P81_ATG02595 [Venturia nashicola]|uniref:Zn(2)-C6 fungal-type domain-containing protein n=1 Tax=Venturia nashicola TaxID=86259 RepID=A0A4Z1PPG1_9PEZI|nr:hypothetical protein E6O75_ATG02659 [Venturia nashicola]TLD36813.1 hypothetical protein E2P81_ATG02595 [Venturia nashicola]
MDRQRISRACDACKLRKVKCNGQLRCQQCSHLDLRCVYTPATGKKRSQGRRGRVITEYKQKTAGLGKLGEAPLLPTSPSQPETPEYDASFFLGLLPDYMSSVYPPQPIIPELEVREYVQNMLHDAEARAFVLAFGAVTLNLTCTGEKRTEHIMRMIEHLVMRAIEARGLIMAKFHASVPKTMTSIFLHNCLMTMRDSDTAFYYMRDAVTLVQLLRIDAPLPNESITPTEKARRQRLYWQIYVHERFLAILDYRPAVMPPLAALPDDDPTIPLRIQEGFNQIIKLFRLLDTEFLQNWLGSHETSTVTPAWIESKHQELDNQDESDLHQLAALSSMQRADLVITRQWLRTLVWRMAMSKTLLSSKSSKGCLSLLFPVRLSQQLRLQVTSMSREAIEIHGSGIVQKLFEITDTIADVLINIPAGNVEETLLRVDDFIFLLGFVFQFPTLDQTRRGILRSKLETLQTMFPEMANSPATTVASASPMLGKVDPWMQVTWSMIPEPAPEQLPAAEQIEQPQQWCPPEANHHVQRNEIARRLSVLDPAQL